MAEMKEQHLNRKATVRRAEIGDGRLLAQLGARLFEQTFAAANDPEDMRIHLSTAFTIEAQEAELADADRAVWIAEDAGRAAVGYAMLRRGSVADGVTAAKPAEVQRIYVDQPWHGQGVGEALMRACIDQAGAWHCDALWLGVWERNPRAIAFYEKSGFRAVGSHTFMLGRDLQHDVVMVRDLR